MILSWSCHWCAGAVLAENFWEGLAPSASQGAEGWDMGRCEKFFEFMPRNGEISCIFTDCQGLKTSQDCSAAYY